MLGPVHSQSLLPKEEPFLQHPGLAPVLAGDLLQPQPRCPPGSSEGCVVQPPVQTLPESPSPT